MSEIKKLIERLCPDGVEYRKLVDLAEVGTGSSNKQDSTDDGKYPFFVRSKFVERHNDYEYDEEAIIIPGEGGIGDIFHYINGKYALHQRVYRIHFITNSVNAKFAYYYLRNSFKKYILGKAVSATVTSIRKPMIQNFEIPVPPMEVQCKIVEILDNFTELEAELEIKLEAELEARRKQYEYYRNQLLTFDKDKGARFDVKWMKLGEICDTLSGFPFDSSKFKDEGIQLMRGANIKRGYFDFSSELNKYWESSEGLEKYLLEPNDIIISMDGSLVGKSFCYLKKEHLPLLLVQRVARLRTKENFKYIYYNITNSFSDYVDKKKTAGAIPHISMKDINGFTIPLPPLEEQNRIVSILDRFEALTTDLQSGLPAEIEARRKQYEYYREQLLSFKRKEN